MNTSVSFELGKLLKEKDFKKKCTSFYDLISNTQIDNAPLGNYNLTKQSVSIPTIAEVIMWLYEKHEYWCYVYTNGKIWHPCIQHKFGDMAVLSGKIGESNSPTEAYEAAIEYTLKNLL